MLEVTVQRHNKAQHATNTPHPIPGEWLNLPGLPTPPPIPPIPPTIPLAPAVLGLLLVRRLGLPVCRMLGDRDCRPPPKEMLGDREALCDGSQVTVNRSVGSTNELVNLNGASTDTSAAQWALIKAT